LANYSAVKLSKEELLTLKSQAWRAQSNDRDKIVSLVCKELGLVDFRAPEEFVQGGKGRGKRAKDVSKQINFGDVICNKRIAKEWLDRNLECGVIESMRGLGSRSISRHHYYFYYLTSECNYRLLSACNTGKQISSSRLFAISLTNQTVQDPFPQSP
jgi:hypothetical protein